MRAKHIMQEELRTMGSKELRDGNKGGSRLTSNPECTDGH
jgi:hypothetical protein